MEKIKNFGTITISEGEDEGTKLKKRTITKETFIRNEKNFKRQNTQIGKQSRLESQDNIAKGKDVIQSNKPFNSDYRRGVNDEGSTPTMSTIRKRLCFTKGEGSTPKSGLGRGRQTAVSSKTNTIKLVFFWFLELRFFMTLNIPHIEQHFKCAFKTTSDLKLDHVEVKVCAYVFQEDFDSSDIIFKVGRNECTRADFECMLLGMLVSREIILMMALRLSWTQQNTIYKTLWCLPPSFADDVAKGNTIEALHKFYEKDWMGRFDRLRLIYVPIEDGRGHWYLMSQAIVKLVNLVYDGFINFCGLADFQLWDIVEARGVPNCGNSDNSALWVAEWLNMQNSFSNNIFGVMDEKFTRMAVTMRILLGNHNECNNNLIQQAREYWQLMTTTDENP
ncbi:hypothetical protein QL285_009027 [Trifolium repens]|nr:hypothetical protein QL285_009027 [Trifolium repens]